MMIDFKFLRFNRKAYSRIVDQEGGQSPAESKLLGVTERFQDPHASHTKAQIPWMVLTLIFAALSGLIFFHDVRRNGRGSFDTGYHNDMREFPANIFDSAL